jgi:hypothetical protein
MKPPFGNRRRNGREEDVAVAELKGQANPRSALGPALGREGPGLLLLAALVVSGRNKYVVVDLRRLARIWLRGVV